MKKNKYPILAHFRGQDEEGNYSGTYRIENDFDAESFSRDNKNDRIEISGQNQILEKVGAEVIGLGDFGMIASYKRYATTSV